MDVFVTRDGNRFVWDSEKAASNLVKHGVSFDRALDVFFDPLHELLDAGVADERTSCGGWPGSQIQGVVRCLCGSRGGGDEGYLGEVGETFGEERA